METTSINDYNINELSISNRAINCLLSVRIFDFGQLMARRHELNKIKGIGGTTLNEIEFAIEDFKKDYGNKIMQSINNFSFDKMETPIVQTFEQLPAAMQWLVSEVRDLKEIISKLTACQSSASIDEYITRKEAAAKLHLSLNTLDTYSQDGKLKAYCLGNRVLYKAHEINEALKLMYIK